MTEIPIACTLSQAAFQQRQDELNQLRQSVRDMRCTSDGFSLCFDGSTENLMAIAHVMAQERLCCPFLQFWLVAEPGMGSIWLEVTGPDNTAQFLLSMFGFDNQESCASSCGSSQCPS